MKEATKRSIVRWIHIVFAIPILGYIYSPFEKLPNYAPATRFVSLPVMVISGLWMWKDGQVYSWTECSRRAFAFSCGQRVNRKS
jgi:hypothetical protein